MLFNFLLIGSAFAGSFEADWACPRTKITISFNEQGKLQFKPDVLSAKIKAGASDEISHCIADFQKNVQVAYRNHRSRCQGSTDDLCVISEQYLNNKVAESIASSKLAKNFPDLKVNVPSLPSSDSSPRTPTASAEEILRQKISRNEIDLKNLGQNFTHNNRSYKVSDFDNVIGENIASLFSRMSQDEAKQYAQNYLVAKADILKQSSPSENKTRVLNNLNQMFGKIYGDRGAEELAKILECNPEDGLKPIQDILSNLEGTLKVDKCKDLAPGEHKVFRKDSADYYGTGHYLLKRTRDGNYQAVVNVNFKTGGGSMSPQAMLERSKNCLDIASPHMKGPDGKRIQFAVLSPSEAARLPADQRPEPYDITIEPAGHGTDAASYAQNVDCATITHEMLHLLGLCDEYKEDRAKYGDMWNCRVVTKAPSIMRELSTFNDAVGKATNCNCSSATCKAIMNGSDENIKKIYTSNSAYDVIDYRFRNEFCRESYITGDAKNLQKPDQGLVLTNQTHNAFEVESRFISQQLVSPFYKVLRSKIVCTCPSGNANCHEKKNTIVSQVGNPGIKAACPVGATFTSQGSAQTKAGVSLTGDTISIVSTPKLPSLLQPQQFNKILAGPCEGKGADPYNECSEFAYKNNKNGPCNVPDRCRDDKYFMGSQQ